MRHLNLGQALREALHGSLPSGWLYLPEGATLTAATACVLLDDEEMDREDYLTLVVGFPREGLSTDLMASTGEVARHFMDPPSDELLIESFDYYLRFDAFLPRPRAPDPPPRAETQARLDRDFIALLGPERDAPRCRHESCRRGAVAHSALCKRHHFESIQRRPYPFDD